MIPVESTLPFWYWAATLFVLGTVIGSFLNVVIYRLHTGRSLQGSSHCLSCGHPLRWFELIPLLSYIVLRGRCHSCGSYIPLRYALVELLTGVLFAATLWLAFPVWLVWWWLPMLALLVVITVYDLYHLIIPDELVVYVSGLVVVHAIVEMWIIGSIDLSALLLKLGAAVVAFGFFGGLWYFSDGRWIGFGDAKLAVPLAFFVGIPGVFSLIVLSFWVGAAIGIVLLGLPVLVRRSYRLLYTNRAVVKLPKYFTMKSEIPFAPFLIIAFLGVAWLQLDVLGITSYVLSF